MFLRRVSLLLLLALLAIQGTSHATNTFYITGMAQYQAKDLSNAIGNLEQAIGAGGLSNDELVKAYEALAVIEILQGNNITGKEYFQKIIEIEPAYSLPQDASPKVEKVFSEVKKENTKGKTDAAKLIATGKRERLAGIILTSTAGAGIVGITTWGIIKGGSFGIVAGPMLGAGLSFPLWLSGIPLWIVGQLNINDGNKKLGKTSWLENHNPIILYSFDPETNKKAIGLAFEW